MKHACILIISNNQTLLYMYMINQKLTILLISYVIQLLLSELKTIAINEKYWEIRKRYIIIKKKVLGKNWLDISYNLNIEKLVVMVINLYYLGQRNPHLKSLR